MLKILQDSGLKENKFTKVFKSTISNANVENILLKINEYLNNIKNA